MLSVCESQPYRGPSMAQPTMSHHSQAINTEQQQQQLTIVLHK